MNRSAREHALTVSLLQRAERWRQAERRARRLARGRSEDAADATRLADDYRLLAHDLARVRTLMPTRAPANTWKPLTRARTRHCITAPGVSAAHF